MTIVRVLWTAVVAALGLVVLLPLVLATLPLAVLAWLSRALGGLRLRRAAPVSWPEILEYDAELGWKPKPNLDVGYLDYIGDLCSIKTCADGWPGAVALGDGDMYVVGDSYAFGYGVHHRESYFTQVTDLKVKPLAAPGYNMVQGLLLLRKFKRLLAGKTVVWLVCLENDLTENVTPAHPNHYRIPFVRQTERGWTIVTEHLSRERWPFPIAAARLSSVLPLVFTRSAFADRLYSAAEYLLAQASECCRSVGARLVVVTVPMRAQVSTAHMDGLRRRAADLALDPARPDEAMAAICTRLGIGFRAGADVLAFEDFKSRDSHWMPSGHRKIGRLLVRLDAESKDARIDPTDQGAAFGRVAI
jgi:hypothetical protein